MNLKPFLVEVANSSSLSHNLMSINLSHTQAFICSGKKVFLVMVFIVVVT